MASLDVETIVAGLSPGGVLARRLPDYEPRDAQITMARAVARTLEFGGILVVEAGTGTGKSLAYLIPAIHWAVRAREPVIVSTRTINLQEQLVRTDLPFLREHLGIDFTAALVKGRSNYLCRRKAKEIREQPQLLAEVPSRAELASILDWSDRTEDGSLADLGFVPRADAWESVMTEHDDCLRSRCPEYETCFFYRARRAAASADVLVVNHSLLMADQALRAEIPDAETSGILPSASRLVLDEAHHLEDVTTDLFGAHVTDRRIERVLSRLQSARVAEGGILPALLQRLAQVTAPEDRPAADGAARRIEEDLRPRIPELRREARRSFDRLLALVEPALRALSGAGVEEAALRIVPVLRETELWSEVDETVRALVRQIEAFVDAARAVTERLATLTEASSERVLLLSAQLGAHAERLLAVVVELRSFLEDDRDLCRWFSMRSDHDSTTLSLRAAPVEVGLRLRDTLFERFDSIVLTSATLTVEKRFDYFLERSGLAALPVDRVDRLRVASPFRYDDQALLVVPEDIPEPDQDGYEEAVHGAVSDTIEASGGGAFVLFTSHAALVRAHTALAQRLRASGVVVLRQGELDRHSLLERFRRDGSAVLFATDSFWEGVDVRGEGLRAVIIPRLPFRVPREPVQQARMEAIEERGGNPFGEYALPQAVIRLRQGFGRLIRSRHDTGVVVLLDSRVVRRRYGEVFLQSLPPARIIQAPAEIARSEIRKFFRKTAG